jgi:hypothetical protein
MSDPIRTKEIVSVAEMARMCGLSRTRFYQLIGSAFPWPIYNCKSRRPFFTEEMQSICLEVRQRNCGINGKAVLFYARPFGDRTPTLKPKAKPRATKPSNKPSAQIVELVEGVRCLGLTTVTTPQVESAFKKCFPNGTSGADEGAVLRAVFLHIKRQNSDDNVAR